VEAPARRPLHCKNDRLIAWYIYDSASSLFNSNNINQ
jgi:hypothetical protein